MIVIIKDRKTQYPIYKGYVSMNYLKELNTDTAFIIETVKEV